MNSSPEALFAAAQRIGNLLNHNRLSLAVVESCTGGLLASVVTDIPGSSAYFQGGVVTYSNPAKHRLLAVSNEMLDTYGAVSEQVAREMANGVLHLFKADLAISVTGIAGPSGGTPTKPVGLVFICLASAQAQICETHIWSGTRIENKAMSVEAALQLLERHLLSLHSQPS